MGQHRCQGVTESLLGAGVNVPGYRKHRMAGSPRDREGQRVGASAQRVGIHQASHLRSGGADVRHGFIPLPSRRKLWAGILRNDAGRPQPGQHGLNCEPGLSVGWLLDQLCQVKLLAQLADQAELGLEVIDVLFLVAEDVLENVGARDVADAAHVLDAAP